MSNSPEIRLFPRPRVVLVDGPGSVGPSPEVTALEDLSLPSEGYRVRVSPAGIALWFADANGRRYGETTLAQLRAQFGSELPGMEIRDWPDFPVRGYMLDVSRDRVPTRETLERIVELLVLFRINHLQLYTEHTFAYRDHPLVWEKASAVTPEDVRWLDALCRDRGIELVPNQNVFGHMGRWLEHPAYRDRAEAPDGWEAPWGARLEPGVLAPTRENADFCLDLLAELLPNFRSRRININCDETFELGQGRSRADVEKRGRGAVYAEYLRRIIDALHADGHEVLFWGDVVRQYPEQVASLPRENTVGLAWHYEAPADEPLDLTPEARKIMAGFGMDEAALRGFSGHVAPFVEQAFPFWVCPGTSSWNTLIGRLPNAFRNLRDAVETGLSKGAGGVLITDWGDNGHMAPPSIAWLPLAYGGAIAWCLETNRDLDVATCVSEWVFKDGAQELGSAIAELGTLHSLPGIQTPNGSALQFALIREGLLSRFESGSADAAGLNEIVERLSDLDVRVERSAPACRDGDLVSRELRQAMRMARHGAWRIARRAGLACPSDSELALDLRECIAGQESCWLERSRPGGLSDSIDRLRPALAEYES
jgi:hypothetical protein